MIGWFPQEHAMQVAWIEKWKVSKHLVSVGEYCDVGGMTHVDEAHNLT